MQGSGKAHIEMAGIAGVARPDAQAEVDRMLDRMAHRGPAGRRVITAAGVGEAKTDAIKISEIRRQIKFFNFIETISRD